MAAIQCKMCGGMVKLPPGITSGECPYCGTLTTFPKVDDDRRENLYNRAEHFRRSGDFDKAVAAYESLLNDDSSDPEAYWGIAISRFGIEYVEDPATRERIPTCHRVQYESFTSDPDYLSALEHSAGTAEHEIYEREGARIAEIQKNILKISAQEKPFDIFICYKESTDGGTRTKDSAIAQDIYYQLTNAGYKVFFARITLESKLGQQYEPYIFAALNSAKVMLVIGSKAEYFNAVWVKNEWSRFLALKKKDRSRLIIPCYRDMDPYDLPEELSLFQSQDMSKIGFIQDILHGIKKVVKTGAAPAVAQTSSAVPAANPSDKFAALEERIRMFLADKEWDNAVEYCNRILDEDPKNGKIHFLEVMADAHCSTLAELILGESDFEKNNAFKHALNFSPGEEKAKLEFIVHAKQWVHTFDEKYNMDDVNVFRADCSKYLRAEDAKRISDFIDEKIALFKKIEAARKKSYQEALLLVKRKKYGKAAAVFESLSGFADADKHYKECVYRCGIYMMNIGNYIGAVEQFEIDETYKDCKQKIMLCRMRHSEKLDKSFRKETRRSCLIALVVFSIPVILGFWIYHGVRAVEFSDDGKILIEYPQIRGDAQYVIPDGVTTIGFNAFRGNDHLCKVVIPDSVTEIGSDAFSFCTRLHTVNIPDSVIRIKSGAFQYCWSLYEITIPDSVTAIGNGAFKGCDNLKEVSIPEHCVAFSAFPSDCKVIRRNSSGKDSSED